MALHLDSKAPNVALPSVHDAVILTDVDSGLVEFFDYVDSIVINPCVENSVSQHPVNREFSALRSCGVPNYVHGCRVAEFLPNFFWKLETLRFRFRFESFSQLWSVAHRVGVVLGAHFRRFDLDVFRGHFFRFCDQFFNETHVQILGGGDRENS